MNDDIIIPKELFAAINTLFTGVESKILITIIGHGWPFMPSIKYMLKMTGLTQNNHYFINRKKLIDNGYIVLQENGTMSVNTNKILNEYRALSIE